PHDDSPDVAQLRDQSVGQSHAQVFIAARGAERPEWQHGNGLNRGLHLRRFWLNRKRQVRKRGDHDNHYRPCEGGSTEPPAAGKGRRGEVGEWGKRGAGWGGGWGCSGGWPTQAVAPSSPGCPFSFSPAPLVSSSPLHPVSPSPTPPVPPSNSRASPTKR